MPQKDKKLVAGLAISMSMSEKIKEKELERISCIWYFITFKDWTEILLNSESEINVLN